MISMHFYSRYVFLVLSITLVFACNDRAEKKTSADDTTRRGTYAYDAEFLKKHTSNVLELVNTDSSAKILLSAYFQGGDSFNINTWQVPAIIDTVKYDVAQASNAEVSFLKKASFVNYSGFPFEINIRRKIRMVD